MLSDDRLLCRMSTSWHWLALLPKCSVLFLLHAANCIDGVLSSEDEGTQISGTREIQNVAPLEGAPSLVRPVLFSK